MIWCRQGIHYGLIEQSLDKVPIGLGVCERMWVFNQIVNHILVGEGRSVLRVLPDVYQNLLHNLVRKNVVLVVSKKVFWIDGEDVNQALDALREEVIGVLDVVKPIGQHLRVFNQLWDFAGVHINHIARIVHDVVCEDSTNVVRYPGNQTPHLLLRLVLPLLALNVVLQKVSESELVRIGEICLV